MRNLPNLYANGIETVYDSIGDVFEFDVPADQGAAALRKVGFKRQQGANIGLPLFDFSQLTANRSLQEMIPVEFRHHEMKGFPVCVFVIACPKPV